MITWSAWHLLSSFFHPKGRETEALGEIQHRQAFDSFWGRSPSKSDVMALERYCHSVLVISIVNINHNMSSLSSSSPFSRSARPVVPRGKENLMALLHYPQKVVFEMNMLVTMWNWMMIALQCSNDDNMMMWIIPSGTGCMDGWIYFHYRLFLM